MNHPPQAITKDALTAAYAWIQEQPDYIQQLATSKNDLVTLYRRAMKNQEPMNIEDPTSMNFQSSLKELSEELKQFSDSAQIPPNVMLGTPIIANTVTNTATNTSTYNSTVNSTMAAAPATHSNMYASNAAQQFRTTLPSSSPAVSLGADATAALDPISLELIREVKLALNLSNETDALRMLLRLGYEKAKAILPAI